jgi:hypothetical protein
MKGIELQQIDKIVLEGSYNNRVFIELNYFKNSDVWQITDVHGGWCGTFLIHPVSKYHKIEAFRLWITKRNKIRKLNLTRIKSN